MKTQQEKQDGLSTVFRSGRNKNNPQRSTKRSTTVITTHSSNRLLRIGWVPLALLAVLAVAALGQNIDNTGGTITNTNGTIKLKGTWTAIPATIGGTVEYNSAGAQAVAVSTYTNITVSGGNTKTLAGSLSASGAVNIVAGTTLSLSNNTLTVSGATPFSGAGTFSAGTGTVDYSGAAQSVAAFSYYSLTLAGTNTKTAAGGLTILASGTLTIGGSNTLDLGTNQLTANNAGVVFANSGTLKTSFIGNALLVNTGVAIGGIVDYAAAGAQTVADALFNDLHLSGGGTYTLNNPSVAAGYTISGTRNYGTGTFTYNGGSAQTVTGDNYNNLAFSGAGTKTTATGSTVGVAGTLNQAGGALTNDGTVNLTGLGTFLAVNNNATRALNVGAAGATFGGAVQNDGTLNATSGNISFSAGLTNSGTGAITLGGGKTMTVSSTFSNSGTTTFNATSTVLYNNSSAQNIAGATYSNLTLQSSVKTFTNSATVNGALTATDAGVTNSIINTGVTLTLGATSTASFVGNLQVDGTGAISATAGSLVTFSGAAQNINGTAASLTFAGLTLSGTLPKTSNKNIIVNGLFTPSRGITMSGATMLELASGATIGTYGDQEEVIGKMRQHPTIAGTFKFNNENTSVVFSGADGTRTFDMTVHPSTNPTGYVAGDYVNRKINVDYANWATGTADLKIAYTYAERASNNEARTRDFKNAVTSPNRLLGTLSRVASVNGGLNANYGSVTLGGLPNSAFASGDEIILSDLLPLFTSIAAADFSVATTWDENAIPGAGDDVVINTAVTVADATNPSVKSVTINATKSLTLTAGTSGTLTTAVAGGGLTNNGTLAVGANRGVLVNGNLINTSTITNDGTITVQ
jgi:fibronectin-binding autotransporter adhesin